MRVCLPDKTRAAVRATSRQKALTIKEATGPCAQGYACSAPIRPTTVTTKKREDSVPKASAPDCSSKTQDSALTVRATTPGRAKADTSHVKAAISPARATSRVNKATAHTIIRKGKRAISRANSNTANARRRGIVHDTPKTRRAATSRVSSNTANARKPVTVRVTTPDKVKADTSHVSRAINAADTSATSTDSRAKGDTTARADTASERLITTRMLNTA